MKSICCIGYRRTHIRPRRLFLFSLVKTQNRLHFAMAWWDTSFTPLTWQRDLSRQGGEFKVRQTRIVRNRTQLLAVGFSLFELLLHCYSVILYTRLRLSKLWRSWRCRRSLTRTQNVLKQTLNRSECINDWGIIYRSRPNREDNDEAKKDIYKKNSITL